MSPRRTTRLGWRSSARGLLALAALLAALAAQGFGFPPPGTSAPQDPQAPGWPFRPLSPDQSRGQAPTYQPPAYQPGPGQPQAQPAQQPAPGYPGASPGVFPGGYPSTYPGAFPGAYPGGFPHAYPSGYPGGYPAPYPGLQPGSQPGGQPARPAEPPSQPSSPWSAPYGDGRSRPTDLSSSISPPSDRPPRLELEVAQTQPYLMENVLVRARLISDGELATATPEPPSTDLALWQRLEGPTTRIRSAQGRQELVTELVLVVTPLRVGDIEIPPLTLVGSLADRFGQPGTRFTAKSEAIRLQVRPAMSSVSPWLPLRALALRGSLDADEHVEPGQPVTLVIQLDATGATGDQLPSLEPQLRAAALPVYREQTLTKGTLSPDGAQLQGQRIEYYTLIPQARGRLALPELALAWWNVETGTREVAAMPIRTLGVASGAGPFTLPIGIGGGAWLWLPLAGLALLLSGYWAGVWLAQRRARLGAGRSGTDILGKGRGRDLDGRPARIPAGLGRLLRQLDARPGLGQLFGRLLGRVRRQLGRALPQGLRLALAVQMADRQTDPAAWYAELQRLMPHDPSRPPHVPATIAPPGHRLSAQLSAQRPTADRTRLETLLRELEGALYGNQDLDFPRWKRRFRREIGLLGGCRRRLPRLLRRATLPPLNPHPS